MAGVRKAGRPIATVRQIISFARSAFIDKPWVSAYIPAPWRRRTHRAQVAELVDALVSGTSGAIRGGSSPLLGTTPLKPRKIKHLRVGQSR